MMWKDQMKWFSSFLPFPCFERSEISVGCYACLYTSNLHNNCVSCYYWHLLVQVLILQEKLEERDREVERLKHELHPKSLFLIEEKDDSASVKKIKEEVVISGEAGN